MSQHSASPASTVRNLFRRHHPGYLKFPMGMPRCPPEEQLSCHTLEEGATDCCIFKWSPPAHGHGKSPLNLTEDIASSLITPLKSDPNAPPSRAPVGKPNERLDERPRLSTIGVRNTETSAYFCGRPTVFPSKNFDPVKDAKKISKAMRGNDIDNAAIIAILSKRSAAQRVAISMKYLELKGNEIGCDLTKSGSGNFEVLAILSLDSLPDTVAFAVNEFVKGIDDDEHILIQGLVPYPNSFMREVVNSYTKQFHTDVIIDLFRNKRGNFRTMLMALLQGIREENPSIGVTEAEADAAALYKASEIPLSPNAEVFTRILTQRSFEQIKYTAQVFEKNYGTSLENCIRRTKFGGYKDTLIAIVRYAMNKEDLLAEWFHNSVNETGTEDWTLMQLTLSRSEIDLEDIKEVFRKKYNKPLIKAIANATSGDYKRLLMEMIGC